MAETEKKSFPSDTFFHVEGTVVYREYSTDVGDPYYPVPNKRNKDLYAKYQVCVEWQNWQMWPCDNVTCPFSSTRVSFQHNLLLNKMAKNAVRQSVRCLHDDGQIKYFQALAQQAKGVKFVGRLASYKYFNMDQAILNALEFFDSDIKNLNWSGGSE